MKEEKYHLYLDDNEYSKVIQSLVCLKNSLIEQGRYTDAVDDVIIKFSTNHEGVSQPIMKIGYWLHYCSSVLSCFIIDLGRIKFDCTLEDLYPVFQRKCFALEHSILSHLLWVARVAKSVLPRANLLPILLQRRCSI